MTRRAAIYTRVSTEEQATGEIPSTSLQVARCRETADALTISVATDPALIVEETHSGADLRWRGSRFMRLVERAERGEFTDLICLDMDRFCRGGHAAYWEQAGYFENAGVTIHFVNDDIPADIPFRGTIMTARAEAAEWWRKRIREDSKNKREAWAKQGNIVAGNTPPYGFRFVYDPALRSKRNRPIVIGLEADPTTGPILLEMTRAVANGTSVRQLTFDLIARGVPGPKGNGWTETGIRGILRNHTNYGGRRSFLTETTPRPEGSRRPAHIKSANKHTAVPLDKQHRVADGRVVPPEGLTYELWRRAVDQLSDNKAFSPRHAAESEDLRAEKALMFGGWVRCAVCKRGLRVKRNGPARHNKWLYICYHDDTEHEGVAPCVSISTHILDGLVWELAVAALRDPTFFEDIIAEGEAVNGPAVRAASLRAQLTEAEAGRDRLMRQLERLDDDELIADYQEKLRKNKALREELRASLVAAEVAAEAEDARRTTLAAFRAYADEERAGLLEKTPADKRRILRALRVRTRINNVGTSDRVRVVFDIRHLPGAASALDADLAREDPREVITPHFVSVDGRRVLRLESVTSEWLRTEGAAGFAPLPSVWELLDRWGYGGDEPAEGDIVSGDEATPGVLDESSRTSPSPAVCWRRWQARRRC